jgi:hypothetical protein
MRRREGPEFAVDHPIMVRERDLRRHRLVVMGSQGLEALVKAARLEAEGPDVGDGSSGDARGGLRRLAGGANHDVFTTRVDGRPAVIKVFRSNRPGHANWEFEALQRLAGTGIAPEPIWFEPAAGFRPVLVMSHVPGHARRAHELDASAIARMIEAHRRVQSSVTQSGSERAASNHPGAVLDQARALTSRLMSTLASPPPALVAADQWLKTGEAGALVADSLSVFCRGDVNLSNYLWDDDNLVLIDFEDSGLNDPVFEWAAMAEHFTARRATEAIWAALADGAALDSSQRTRWHSARRLVACYWLAVLLRRDQRGEIVVEVTAPEQAERVETILGGPR